MCYQCAADYRDRLQATAAKMGAEVFPSLTETQRQQVMQVFETLAQDPDVYADTMLAFAGFLIEYPTAADAFQKVLGTLLQKAIIRQKAQLAPTESQNPTPASTIADFPEFEKELQDLAKAGLLQAGTKSKQ